MSIAEPGLTELVARGLEDGTLTFTTAQAELYGADLVLLYLPTLPAEDGRPDLGVLEKVVPQLGRLLRPGCVVVTKSTVPVGTAARLPHLLGRDGLPVVGNPEFLREGHAVEDFLPPDRVVGGTDPPDSPVAHRVTGLYEPSGAPVVMTDSASAELAKYAGNAFLAVAADRAVVVDTRNLLDPGRVATHGRNPDPASPRAAPRAAIPGVMAGPFE